MVASISGLKNVDTPDHYGLEWQNVDTPDNCQSEILSTWSCLHIWDDTLICAHVPL